MDEAKPPQAANDNIKQPFDCEECGVRVEPVYGDTRKKYCSKACVRKVELRKRDHLDRARHHGVQYEAVDWRKVMDRDGWKCQICGTKTPKRLRGTTDPRAPELDHRVPMAMGGPHTYDNVQCACRACNSAKGGTGVSGQGDLFPRLVA